MGGDGAAGSGPCAARGERPNLRALARWVQMRICLARCSKMGGWGSPICLKTRSVLW